jgi:hypothetical protein
MERTRGRGGVYGGGVFLILGRQIEWSTPRRWTSPTTMMSMPLATMATRSPFAKGNNDDDEEYTSATRCAESIIHSATPAESMILSALPFNIMLSAPPAESMMLSAPPAVSIVCSRPESQRTSVPSAESIRLSEGESIMLSAPPTESMILSALAESIILSAPLAESMISSAPPARERALRWPVDAKTIFPTLNSQIYIEFQDNIKVMAIF